MWIYKTRLTDRGVSNGEIAMSDKRFLSSEETPVIMIWVLKLIKKTASMLAIVIEKKFVKIKTSFLAL